LSHRSKTNLRRTVTQISADQNLPRINADKHEWNLTFKKNDLSFPYPRSFACIRG